VGRVANPAFDGNHISNVPAGLLDWVLMGCVA
jgi:hypothetical protein